MNLGSKKVSLVILGVTAILCSRAMFFFFNDPEGPNLLVVTGMAVLVYLLSLPVYLFYPPTVSFTGLKRLLLVIFVQILIVTVLYFLLK
jgi:hypothetical protein